MYFWEEKIYSKLLIQKGWEGSKWNLTGLKATKHLAHCCLVTMKKMDDLLPDSQEQKIKAQKTKKPVHSPSLENSLKSTHPRMK